MQHIIYRIIILSTIFVVWSCGNKENKTLQEKATDDRIQISQAQFEQSKMTLGSFEEKSFPTSISVNGMIDVPPENRAVVSASMGGYIKTTPLLVGDEVREGQVLVTIENLEFIKLQQEYMEVSSQLSYLNAEFGRQKTMLEENISSKKSYLKAESEYKTSVAKYNGLRKQLTMIHISPSKVEAGNMTSIVSIYAPISGSITKVNVTKGAYVSPATPILEIIDNDHIHLELSVFEKDIMNVKKDQQINFKIPEASTEVFKASVYLVGTTIENNRTIKVHGHLKNESTNNFLTGMFIEAAIITDTMLSKALPSESIISVDGISYGLILDERKDDIYYFRQQEVILKSNYEGYVVIDKMDSFKVDEQFLTKGIFNLLGE